jgi:hypothetical protein
MPKSFNEFCRFCCFFLLEFLNIFLKEKPLQLFIIALVVVFWYDEAGAHAKQNQCLTFWRHFQIQIMAVKSKNKWRILTKNIKIEMSASDESDCLRKHKRNR